MVRGYLAHFQSGKNRPRYIYWILASAAATCPLLGVVLESLHRGTLEDDGMSVNEKRAQETLMSSCDND